MAFGAIKRKDDCSAFDDTLRYALGFDTVAASADARNVNLDDEAQELYQTMVEKGYSVLYVGSVRRPAQDDRSTADSAEYDFAAQHVGVNSPPATVEDMVGVDFAGFTDRSGGPRSPCEPA